MEDFSIDLKDMGGDEAKELATNRAE